MKGAAFSRSGITHPLGKLTEPVGPFKIPQETKELLERDARTAGLTLNEFIRELVMIRAHGRWEMKTLYDSRISVVTGMVEER